MGKVLLVIGASSDMGMDAIETLSENYEVILAHYNHMNPKLRELADRMPEKMHLIQADLSDEAQVKRMIGEIEEGGWTVSHILHFPAPICKNQKFHKIGWEVFQREMDISMKSLILITQAIFPKMMKAHYGKLVVVLSFVVNGMPPAYCSNYVVTKYAMLGLVKALAVEYASKGITVNGISPAWVNTKYIDNQPDILKEQNAAASPIGRNLEVGDLTPSLRFLLSDDADCINGQNLAITCGR